MAMTGWKYRWWWVKQQGRRLVCLVVGHNICHCAVCRAEGMYWCERCNWMDSSDADARYDSAEGDMGDAS